MKRQHRLIEKVKCWFQYALSLPFYGHTFFTLNGEQSPSSPYAERWKGLYDLLGADLFIAEFGELTGLAYNSTTALEYFKYGMVYASRQDAGNALGCWQGLFDQPSFKESVVLRNNLACLKHSQGDIAIAQQLLDDAIKQFVRNEKLFTSLPNGRGGAEIAFNSNRSVIGVPATASGRRGSRSR